ncbi:MAG TPA: TIGR03118 family protein [Acidimicrobiales bacterium]|nr:TIGR03118 family protein [Acidimicrobiales bacterium]
MVRDSLKRSWKRRGWRPAIAGGAVLAMGGLLAVGTVGPAGADDPGVYRQTNLVSDIAGVARKTDPNLVNPWGMSEPPGGPLWVSDNNADVSTLYTGAQHGGPLVPVPLVVTIPGGAPTGQVNNTTGAFVVTSGTASGPARFIFASENGDITGWNPNVPAQPAGTTSNQAQTAFSDPNAVYKGLAIDSSGPAPRIFATNFRAGTIDVFNGQFQKQVNPPGAFVDPTLPTGYAPFNIANLGGKLYVSYALQNAAKHDDVSGAGHGFIDVYALDGTMGQRLVTRGDLNSPWGLILATHHFGHFSDDLLVGNFGDGKIHAYEPTTGAPLGTLTNPDGDPIQINGLWGLIFGDKSVGTTNTLFFSAGIADETHGLLGTLTPGHERERESEH